LNGYTLGARDGAFGKVGDFSFDDRTWAVQHLVAHTGSWLADRLVLIPAAALHPAKPGDRSIPVDLTKEEITSCPPPDIGPSSQHPPHLRRMWALTGCHLQAEDGELGHIEDFVIDDETWTIRYVIVDTRNWWAGKRVLLSPQWVERVNWTDSKVGVALHRDTIEQAPEYSPDAPITREYEAALYRHYQREQYW
jgi:hypothetical protein